VTAALYVGGGTALLCALSAAWMAVAEPRLFRVWRVVVPRRTRRSPGCPSVLAQRLPPLTILHISDTHFGAGNGAKLRFLRRVAQEPYDLAALTGDLIDTPKGLRECMELAEMLRPRLGCFAVLGGHDYFRNVHLRHRYLALRTGAPPENARRPNPVQQLREGLARRGVNVLEDENRLIRCPGGEELAIVGLRDAFVFRPDYEAAWRGVPPGTPTIVLAHSPDVLEEVVRRGADLAFFGHTHGGQVRLPVLGAIVTRSAIGRRRARGVFQEGGTVFCLNNGVGAGRATGFRLLCRPEVTLMRLASADDAPAD